VRGSDGILSSASALTFPNENKTYRRQPEFPSILRSRSSFRGQVKRILSGSYKRPPPPLKGRPEKSLKIDIGNLMSRQSSRLLNSV